MANARAKSAATLTRSARQSKSKTKAVPKSRSKKVNTKAAAPRSSAELTLDTHSGSGCAAPPAALQRMAHCRRACTALLAPKL